MDAAAVVALYLVVVLLRALLPRYSLRTAAAAGGTDRHHCDFTIAVLPCHVGQESRRKNRTSQKIDYLLPLLDSGGQTAC